jgi:hypothetical protein
MKSTSLAAERQLEKALEVVRGVKSTLLMLSEVDSDFGDILGYLGRDLDAAHHEAVCAYGRIFFGDGREEGAAA